MSMIIDGVADDFTNLLGDALAAFLRTGGINESEAATRLDMVRGTLNTYTSGVRGDRRRPPAELLAKACVLLGFEFEYEATSSLHARKGSRSLRRTSNYISNSPGKLT